MKKKKKKIKREREKRRKGTKRKRTVGMVKGVAQQEREHVM